MTEEQFTPHDTKALDDFIEYFKEKYNPSLYGTSDYGKFLGLVNDMVINTSVDFKDKYVVEIQEER